MRLRYLLVVCLLLITVLLTACQPNTPTPPDTQPSTDTVSSFPTTDPANPTESVKPVVKEGTLLTVPLEVVSWENQRTTDCSFNQMAETESGYYLQRSHLLYYADKANLDLWVPLCTKAVCSHSQGSGCGAYIGAGFFVKENRIYFLTSDPDTSIPWQNLAYDYVGSMALDGTDRKKEYHMQAVEEQVNTFDCGGNRSLTPDMFFVYLCSMTEDGTYSCNAYVRDETGEYVIPCGQRDEKFAYCKRVNGGEQLYGDFCYYIPDIDGSLTMVYRLKDRELYGTELADLPITGGYLEGNNFRCFYANDGYYDVDLTTRELTHLADAQLPNSQAFIMQHNCILETTLVKDREPDSVDTHQLRFFDGQNWHEVVLPEELTQVGGSVYLKPAALTSDRVIIEVVDSEYTPEDPLTYGNFYQMLLDNDTVTLEHLVTFE